MLAQSDCSIFADDSKSSSDVARPFDAVESASDSLSCCCNKPILFANFLARFSSALNFFSRSRCRFAAVFRLVAILGSRIKTSVLHCQLIGGNTAT